MVGFDPSLRPLSKTQHAAAGALSGVVTRAIAQPLDVVKIRFQLQVEPIRSGAGSKYEGVVQACRSIYREEGLRALWKGHVPAQALSVVFGVSQFVTFEVLTRHVWERLPPVLSTDPRLRAVTHFSCGGLAGCVATVAAQPFDVIRTRFVAQGSHKVYNSMAGAFAQIVSTEGPRALFRGLTPTLIQIAPQTGLHFGFYTAFTTLWRSTLGPDKESQGEPTTRKSAEIGALQSLVCGSASGLAAKLVVYPLDMTKKRLQIQGFQHGRAGFGSNPTYTGFIHCVRTVAAQEGMTALYKGLSPSLLKAMVTAASHFFVYEQCCRMFRVWGS